MDGFHTSSFLKGLNQDVAKPRASAESYTDASDIRVVTEKGSSTGSVENILGNKLFFEIPSVSAAYLIENPTFPFQATRPGADDYVDITSWTMTTTVTLTSSAGISVTVQLVNTSTQEGSTSIVDLATIIKDAISNNAILTANGVTVGVTSGSIKVYSNSGLLTSITSIISFTSTPIVANVTIPISVHVPQQDALIVIGWGVLRDTIVLFTTNDTTDDGGYGQIWSLVYDPANLDTYASAVLTLLYNENIGFTTKHLIESPCVCRYETTDIQRIYWTDNHNDVRSFNIADDESMFIDESLLNLEASVSFSKPIVKEVLSGGNLKAAYYQYAYRLKGTNGELTKFSIPSNTVHVFPESETTGLYQEYSLDFAWTTNTHKIVKVEISDIDADYDTIEVVSILLDGLSGTPTVSIIKELSIPENRVVTISHTGSEDNIPLTLEEYSIASFGFSKCKTLASKDNRLIAGNVTGYKFHNKRFNARAYRYRNYNGVIDTYVADGTLTGANAVDPINDTSISTANLDAVNPFNNASIDLIAANQYKYWADGTTLGGEGPNVSYRFITEELQGDKYTEAAYTSAQPVTAPFVDKVRSSKTMSVGGQDHPHVNTWYDFKSPYAEGTVKGYMRGEVYRFAIVLFDTKGKAGFAEWIGDIKFPEHYDSSNPWLEGDYIFATNYDTTTSSRLQQKLYSLGIEFSVKNLPTGISGYSIVRMPRGNADKTRLGTGVLNRFVLYKAHTSSFASNFFDPSFQELSESSFWNIRETDYSETVQNYSAGTDGPLAEKRFYSLDSPDFQLIGSPSFVAGDKIRIVGEIRDLVDNQITYTLPAREVKVQRFTTAATPYSFLEKDIVDSMPIGEGEKVTFQNIKFINSTLYLTGAAPTNTLFYDRSSKSLILHFQPFDLNDYVSGVGKHVKALASYIRPLQEQYGGATQVARSQNSYVYCGHFVRIDDHQDSQYVKVFGGDTYVTMYDYTKYQTSAGLNSQGIGMIFPTETTINTDLTSGKHFAAKTTAELETELFDVGRDYTGVSLEGNGLQTAITFFAEPFNKNFVEEFDNEVWISEHKINGEDVDQWRSFLDLNALPVEGIYGPINKLQVLKDQVYFIQDKAFGRLVINPRVTVPSTEVTFLQIGTGGVLDDYEYISTEYGSKHQSGITASDSSIFFFDVIRKKFLQYTPSSGISPLSEIKGLSSFFSNNFTGGIQTNDNTIDTSITMGVTATYDYRFYEALFTFFDTKDSIASAYTVAYNELLGAFTSFYSFTPSMYINDKRLILSPSTSVPTQFYRHNAGEYGVFYDGTPVESFIQVLANKDPHVTKAFTNIDFMSECYDSSDADVMDETVDSLNIYNEYQNTGFITLTPPNNVRKLFRTWRIAVPRDTQGARIRGPYCNIELGISNANNRRFILHNVNTYYLYS